MKLSVRIVILNFEGAELLPLCLPSVVKSLELSAYPASISILQNPGAREEGLEYVQTQFPQVEIYRARDNRVLCSYNEYLPLVKEPIVILLNNDIRVAPSFINPLVQPFLQDPKTFLVAPLVMDFEGKRIEAARCEARFRFGFFESSARYPGYLDDAMASSGTFSSGFGAFSRQLFLELGGYDDIYLPGIMEDVDLCYRASLRGLHLRYEPSSCVYHMGQANFKKRLGTQKISILAYRNNFLFMWKNFSGPVFWLNHVFFLPLRVLMSALKGDTARFKGLVEALIFMRGRRWNVNLSRANKGIDPK